MSLTVDYLSKMDQKSHCLGGFGDINRIYFSEYLMLFEIFSGS